MAIFFAGQAAGRQQGQQAGVQGGFGEGLEGGQVQVADQVEVGLGVRQPGLFQGLGDVAGGRAGEAAVPRAAVEGEGVGMAVAALLATFGAAMAAARAFAEGIAQEAVEVHHRLEGQAFVDFEQVGDQGFFGAHSAILV